VGFDERAPEGHPRGQVGRVDSEPGAADLDRLFDLTNPPELLGKLGEGNRRRIGLDPAAKRVDAMEVERRAHVT
jgi:hypothetical protein